jgi:hypothetical protein
MDHTTGHREALARLASAVGLIAAGMLHPASARAASPLDVYYERAVMAAADGRCRLFSPGLSSALVAARAQARGAALRAGADDGAVLDLTRRAEAKAASVPCGSPDLDKAAGRVRAAFVGYSRMSRLDLPGDASAWRADRTAPSDGAAWRLSETAVIQGGAVTFGLAGRQGQGPQLVAVADFGDGPQPYAARLLVRDRNRAPRPYLGVLRVSATAAIPLSSRTPPRAAAKVFPAEARGAADVRLRPAGARSAVIYRFPAEAIDEITALDPREAVVVEFLFSGASGDVARPAYIEVGDFAAGQAFIELDRR